MPGPIPVTVSRPARQGKIRWGIRNAKGWPQAIDTFRFTSPDQVAIDVLADLYGGTPQRWDEPAAAERNQWEVITESNVINVWIVPGQMSRGYEYWQGGICNYRCDGIVLSKLVTTADGNEHVDEACLCGIAEEMTCKPKLRMQFILPEVPMGGVWGMETSSWNAFLELPGIVYMLETLQGQSRTIEPARLILTDQSKKTRTKASTITKRFKVPKLVLPRTAQQLQDNHPGDVVPAALPAADGVGDVTYITQLPQPQPAEPAEAEAEVEVVVVVPDSVPATARPVTPTATPATPSEGAGAVGVWSSLADAVRGGKTRDQVQKRDGKWYLK